MAIIVDSGRRIPFLRGMLTHYLLEQGFSFREAYQVADRVRSSIQKQKKVPAGKMIDLVHTHARELFGDRPVGDGVFWAPRSRQILVEDDLGTRPFSKDHLSDSLAITGVDESQAYRIAERIEGDFIQNDSTVVSRDDILKATLNMLRSDSGDAFAERYGIWNRFRNGGRTIPLIVLIGGGTGVGKTTVGVALANLLRVSRVASTDEIRQVMRLMISSDLMPELTGLVIHGVGGDPRACRRSPGSRHLRVPRTGGPRLCGRPRHHRTGDRRKRESDRRRRSSDARSARTGSVFRKSTFYPFESISY